MAGLRYSREELFFLQEFGDHHQITYQVPGNLESLYLQRTGIHRAHACLYMAYWRLCNGVYEDYMYRGSCFAQQEFPFS